jgi:predicted Zn finger-like uncharacterized protein
VITTCPQCRTAFRVTDEQLGARGGRVRCGKCTTVFNAREALLADIPPAASEPPAQGSAPSVPAAKQRPATAGEGQAAIRLSGLRPRHRLAWGLGSGLLTLVLMAQVSFHYRGELALLFPQARPALEQLCSNLGCNLPLPRRAELISIETSDLQADPANPSVMVLTATLRNRAAFPQSHPALELTLTDLQDQPLARRVLGPQDYLGRGVSIETGFPGNSELPVKVYMEAASLKATGYRLYLFYP